MTDDNQLSAKEKREIERAAAIVQREHRAAFQLARAALERASDPKEPHAALWAIAYFLSQVAIETAGIGEFMLTEADAKFDEEEEERQLLNEAAEFAAHLTDEDPDSRH